MKFVSVRDLRGKSAEVWIVYKNPADSRALKSSDLGVVSKRTGRVRYEASAGDEG